MGKISAFESNGAIEISAENGKKLELKPTPGWSLVPGSVKMQDATHVVWKEKQGDVTKEHVEDVGP